MKFDSLRLTVLCFCFLALRATATTYYVDINSPNPTPPYSSWSTAATDIQSAVDAASPGDLVQVTNGVYQTGGEVVDGSMTNRVVVSKAIAVQSVNGPAATVIQGYQDTITVNGQDAVRCVYLSDGAVLSGFTLTNGATQIDTDESRDYTLYTGGGVFCDATNVVVTNCVISGCLASDAGGGAEGGNTFLGTGGGTFLNCAFVGNQCIAAAGADQCILSNCTLTANAGQYGGGASESILLNCALTNNTAVNGGSGAGGGVFSCVLIGCTLATNLSDIGGGAFGNGNNPCSLSNCSLIGNSTTSGGGGANGCTLSQCSLVGNSAADGSGGGAQQCILTNCSLTANSAAESGGADSSTLNNCTLTGNIAANGGGAGNSTLNNCALSDNSAGSSGGGAESSTLNNCTLIFNSALNMGGGADSSTLNNCIAYFNSAPSATNYSGSTLNYCCTTPLPLNGTNDIIADPQLTDLEHISASSPCIRAGSTNYSSGLDFDGKPWLNPPSIGCNQYYTVATGAPATVAILASYTNVGPGYGVNFAGLINGQSATNSWDFGDGTTVGNQLFVTHSWTTPGTYIVTFTVHDPRSPGHVTALVIVRVTTQQVWYVDARSTIPVSPFTAWNTAAAKIQDAVDAAVPGGTVLVTNGTYATGGRVAYGALTNRVVINKPITLQSVNGPGVTFIQGCQDTNTVVADDAARCVFLGNNAVLSGFTLTQGATRAAGDISLEQRGGGVWCQSTNAIVTNCVIIENAANNGGGGANQGSFNACILAGNESGASGGGALNSLLNNCVLTNNVAGTISAPAISSKSRNKPTPMVILSIAGGGAEASTLNNCVVTNNSAQVGGGLDTCTANNCLVLYNTAILGGGVNGSALNNCTIVGNIGTGDGAGVDFSTLNNCIDVYNSGPDQYSTFNYCCSDLNTGGNGNITNNPAFVDWQNNNFHLTANSPCINSGDNLYVTTTNDFDGNRRIVGGTVDMGAYEYQTPTSVLSYAWAQQYGLPTDGSEDYLDLDGTGMNNWQKWIAGLDPTNPASVLVMLSPAAANNSSGITVTWQSVDNRNYNLLCATNLAAQAAFWPIASNIAGQAGTTSYTDPNATNNGAYFYRVAIQ